MQSSENAMKCSFVHPEWGRCQQPGKGIELLCTYHSQGRDRHDDYYHRKIVLGLLQPTEDYIDAVEMDTLFRGRARHDGRRLDAWTKY